MNRHCAATRGFAIAILLSMPVAYASDRFYDYARVIDAQAIVVSERIPVRREVCTQPSAVSPPGDARLDRPQASIGELIKIDSRQRRPDCRTVSGYDEQQKTVGWRVTYRYAGKDFVRRMKDKPGSRIRVRVDMDANQDGAGH